MLVRKTICAVALLFAASGFAWAEDSYPSRQVTIVVPFPAGGPADLFPRLLTDPLRAALGQAIVIENRSGAGGNTGLEFVARAAPDGYTLLNSVSVSIICCIRICGSTRARWSPSACSRPIRP